MTFDPKRWDEMSDEQRANYIRDNTTLEIWDDRPLGIFTREQVAKIKSLAEAGKTAEAQKIILDALDKEFPE